MMKRWAAALRLVGIGWYIAICILLGIVGGQWLGRTVHSEGLFILLGLALGLVLAFLGVYRMLLPLMGDNDKGNS